MLDVHKLKVVKRLEESYSKAVEAYDSLTEAEIKKRTYYKDLKKNRNLALELGDLRAQKKALKMAGNENLPDVAINRLKPKEKEYYDEYKELSANERESKLNNIEDEMDKVNEKIQKTKRELDVMSTVMKLEPARAELEEQLGERGANQIITTYAALLDRGIPSLGKGKEGYYAREFDVTQTSENPKHTDEEVREAILDVVSNPQKAVNYPDIIKMWVTHVLNTDRFHETWKIEVANERYGIVSKLSEIKEGEGNDLGASSSTVKDMPWQDKIVASDGNWITYEAEGHEFARKVRDFYSQAPHTRNSEAMKKTQGTAPSWCVVNGSNGPNSADYHHSYKCKGNQGCVEDATWFVTYNLNNPIKEIAKYLKEQGDIDSVDRFMEEAENGGLAAALNHGGHVKLMDKFFGEIYLKTSDDSNNYGGRHLWSNSGSGRKTEALIPSVSYDYESDNLKISGKTVFQAPGGILETYSGDEEKVIIPYGVREIGEEAFADNKRIKAVMLPTSCTRIGRRAFAGCDNLVLVAVSHNLHEVSKTAFEGIEDHANLGVLAIEDGEQYLEKPRNLTWYPDHLAKEKPAHEGTAVEEDDDGAEDLDNLPENDVNDIMDEVTRITEGTTRRQKITTRVESVITINEADINLKDVEYRAKRNLYTSGPQHEEFGELYYIENGILYYNEKAKGARFDESWNIEEGVITFGTPIYASYRDITLPRSFGDISPRVLSSKGPLFNLLKIPGTLDMSKASTVEIPMDTFGSVALGTLKLPENNLRVLGGWRTDSKGALQGVRMRELYINVKNFVDVGKFVKGGDHDTVFKGLDSVFLRKVHTDDPQLFELLSGHLTDMEQLDRTSKAAEVVEQNKDKFGEGEEVDLSKLRNQYLASRNFRATVVKDQ